MIKIYIILLGLASLNASAQMVSASLFGEMKSINPAVVSTRNAGQLTFIGSKIKANKDQNVDGDKQKLELNVTDMSLFRGGKGKGFTTEFTVKQSTGDSNRSTATGTETAKATQSYSSFNMGFSTMGLGLAYSKFDYKSNPSSLDQTVTSYMGVWGYRSTLFGLDTGLIVQGYASKIDLVADETGGMGAEGDSPSGMGVQLAFGAGLGFGSGATHFEFSIESTLQAVEEQSETGEMESIRPMRLSGTAEFKLWGISLGYTGRAYLNGYEDPEQIVFKRIIFPKRDKLRLEHNFNFSLGATKGIQISGAASFSTITNEEPKSMIDPASLTYPTTTKLIMVSVKLGYAW